jgi:succinylglutamic semialdehyde dehydrogenase
VLRSSDVIAARGDYLDGRFRRPERPDGEIVRESPNGDGLRVGTFPTSLAAVDDAVEAARRAQPAWGRLPLGDRAAALARLKDAFASRGEGLARLVALEIGKALWEARTEIAGLGAKIDVTVREAAVEIAPRRPENLRGGTEWRPLGTVAVLGPFNFPLHLPHGQIVAALLAGNAVVFKPSELAPAAGQAYAEAADAAGLPPGVFGLVQGDGRAGAHLAAHRDVGGVLFTGSYATGRRILEATLDRPGKLVALEMGGKNAAVVLADADLDRTAAEIAQGATLTTGQRCSATSRLVVARSVAGALVDRVARLFRGLRIGDPLAEDTYMGPLVSVAARARYLAALAAADADAEVVVAGGAVDRPGAYVAPSLRLVTRRDPTSAYQRDELFGPDLAVYPVEDLDEAIALANDTEYGLVASLFSTARPAWDEFRARVRAGVLHWNRSTAGASGRLPFGGLGRSGNHRPAGVMMIRACAVPVAVLEDGGAAVRPPGFPEG